jgi:hypothetical protein
MASSLRFEFWSARANRDPDHDFATDFGPECRLGSGALKGPRAICTNLPSLASRLGTCPRRPSCHR